MDDALLRRVQDYLDRHNVMTLATHGPGGPWAAAVFYARDGLRLYFVSSPGSRHAQDLAASPRAGAAIHEDYRGWTEIQGVQLEGRVAPVADPELSRVRAIYAAKFPFAGKAGEVPAALLAALARVRWYVLEPEALHFLDNSRGFSHRERLV
jgi:uncharacterized protein YhbP (UPF0306 family)